MQITKSTKRGLSNLENGGSTKKQKYIDRERLKRKELETPKRGRPKSKKSNSYQDNSPNLIQSSHEDTRKTRFRDKSKGMKSSTGKPSKQSTITDNEILSDYDGAGSIQQVNTKVQNRRNSSSKKSVANGSPGKVLVKCLLISINNLQY